MEDKKVIEISLLDYPAHRPIAGGYESLDEDKIKEILDLYGLETILKDAGMKEWEVLEVLHDRGFIDLEVYDE